MATVSKRDLVIRVSEKVDLTQYQVSRVVQELIDEITDCLESGDNVVLRNFGAFQITMTKPKIGRNPKKPQTPVKIPPRRVVKFKPGKEMKERVAQGA